MSDRTIELHPENRALGIWHTRAGTFIEMILEDVGVTFRTPFVPALEAALEYTASDLDDAEALGRYDEALAELRNLQTALRAAADKIDSAIVEAQRLIAED